MRVEDFQDEDMRQAFLAATDSVAQEDKDSAYVKSERIRRKLRWLEDE